jgi:tetratricopeptide (TPR) repeat protein
MRKEILSLLLCVAFGCTTPCSERINLLPMYGRQLKCAEQMAADNEFLALSDKQYATRRLASEHYAQIGWGLFYEKQFDTAIKRFNQAWLLDSTNAEPYWGFASVLGMRQQFRSSVSLFKRYLVMNPTQAKAWEGLGMSYGQLFFQSKKQVFLDSSITATKKCVKIDPTYARGFAQLAAAYAYYIKKDSARKYLVIVDKLNPAAVNPEARKMIIN